MVRVRFNTASAELSQLWAALTAIDPFETEIVPHSGHLNSRTADTRETFLIKLPGRRQGRFGRQRSDDPLGRRIMRCRDGVLGKVPLSFAGEDA
jgi:hypothetical protein